MIKALVFDIGGVFLAPDISPAIFGEFAMAIEVPPEKFLALQMGYMDRMLTGTVSANSFFGLIKKEFKIKKDIKKIWIETVIKNVKVNKALFKITDSLRARYPIMALSNVTEARGLVDKKLDLYRHFDRTFLSYKIKMKKPSKRIYAHLLKQIKMKPDEVLFIDDREANLKPARELGIRCIQFNNNAQLVTEFTRWGLL